MEKLHSWAWDQSKNIKHIDVGIISNEQQQQKN